MFGGVRCLNLLMGKGNKTDEETGKQKILIVAFKGKKIVATMVRSVFQC